MFKKNKNILILGIAWAMLYTIFSYFIRMSTLMNLLLTTVALLTHIKSKSVIKEILMIELPVFIIAIILKSLTYKIYGEYILLISAIIYISTIYLYGKIRTKLIR